MGAAYGIFVMGIKVRKNRYSITLFHSVYSI